MEYYVNVKKNKFCLEKTRNVQLTVFERRTENQNMHDDCTVLFPSTVWNFLRRFAHACSVLFHWHLVRNQNVLREALKRKLKNEVGNNSRRRHQSPKQNKGRSYRMSNRDENICFQFDGLKWMWVWQPVPGPVQRADRTSPPQHEVDSREPQISY